MQDMTTMISRSKQPPRTGSSYQYSVRRPEKITSMKSWRAPGPDMIHDSWFKELTVLYERLAAQMNLNHVSCFIYLVSSVSIYNAESSKKNIK